MSEGGGQPEPERVPLVELHLAAHLYCAGCERELWTPIPRKHDGQLVVPVGIRCVHCGQLQRVDARSFLGQVLKRKQW